MTRGTTLAPSPLQPQPQPQPRAAGSLRICALLTCFNRRDKTLECLRALAASVGLGSIHLHAVLVDDGSTDGTSQAVRAEFAWVQVVEPDASAGPLFWCRGMHLAFETALRQGFDHYLWLNDDTMLQPGALARLLACESQLRLRPHAGAAVIVAGSTVDAATGALTYGGERRASKWKPLGTVRVQPGDHPQRCDSMTGNIVLISADAACSVGNIDPLFEHAMGDTDYGFRAVARGVEVWIDAGVHGTCSDNPTQGTWRDPTQPLARRWRGMLSRKGLPWRSWLAMTRRHAGPLWPFYFVQPYAKVVLQGLLRSRIKIARERGC